MKKNCIILRLADDSDDDMEYDQDGNPIIQKKDIDPLPPIDHSTVQYKDFCKNFYEPHEDIVALNHFQINELRNKLGLTVSRIV